MLFRQDTILKLTKGITMARSQGMPQRLETITSNRLTIRDGSLIAGDISFQIRNIASLLVKDTEIHGIKAVIIIALIAGVLAAGGTQNPVVGLIAGGAVLAIGIGIILSNQKQELVLLTNAATSFKLIHWDRSFLLWIKRTIEEAMLAPDARIYNIDMTQQKINVSGSPGTNIIGGDAVNSAQTSNVSVVQQGLQDIAEFAQIVEAANVSQKELIVEQLAIIRNFLAGGTKTKPEAKAAWQSIVEHAGALAGAGSKVWELIGRVSQLFA